MNIWTKTEEDELRKLYADRTLSMEEIAARIGRPVGGVSFHAAKIGLRRIKVLEQHESEIRSMYLGGAQVGYIAKCFGVTVGQMRTKLCRMKLLRRPPRYAWTLDEDKEVRKLFDLGVSTKMIARELGRSYDATRHRLVTLHLHRRKSPWKLHEERLLILYYEKERRPIREISQLFNKTVNQVYNKAARMGLQRRK